MKKVLRKATSILCILALALSTVSVTVWATNDDFSGKVTDGQQVAADGDLKEGNLAYKAKAYGDEAAYGNLPWGMNDAGFTGSTRWQSRNASGREGGTTDGFSVSGYEDNYTFAALQWNEKQKFTSVKIYFETDASYGTADNQYQLLIPAEGKTISLPDKQVKNPTEQYKTSGGYFPAGTFDGDEGVVIDGGFVREEWQVLSATLETNHADYTYKESETKKYDVLSFDAVETDWIALYIPKAINDFCIVEWEVYDNSGKTYYNASALSTPIKGVERAFGSTVPETNPYSYSAESWSAFYFAYQTVKSTYNEYNEKETDSSKTYKTQEELAAAIPGMISALNTAAAKLTGDGNVTTNRLENGIMIYDGSKLSAWTSLTNYRSLTDGKKANDENVWQPPQNQGKNIPVYLKLNNPSEFNKIVLYTEASDERYKIEVTTADVSNITNVDGMAALEWTDTEAKWIAGFTVSDGIAYHFYTFADYENITAIKLTCSEYHEGGWCKLREVEAYGVQAGVSDYAPCFADQIQLESKAASGNSGKVDRLIITNVDEGCFSLTNYVKATFTIERDGKKKTESVAITDSYSAIRLSMVRSGGATEEATLTSLDVGGQDDHYVVGLLLADVLSTDKITVEFTITEEPLVEE